MFCSERTMDTIGFNAKLKDFIFFPTFGCMRIGWTEQFVFFCFFHFFCCYFWLPSTVVAELPVMNSFVWRYTRNRFKLLYRLCRRFRFLFLYLFIILCAFFGFQSYRSNTNKRDTKWGKYKSPFLANITWYCNVPRNWMYYFFFSLGFVKILLSNFNFPVMQQNKKNRTQ